jgi:type II secretory ATPase GspE/PulE/Tfp pilus assembly ATPase PilB-like protein
MVDRWKVMAEMNVAEQRVPQDGRISVRYEGNHYELRVNVLPTATGERVTARLINRSSVLIGLDRLGLSAAQQATIRRLLDRPRGLMMVGGFEAAGKTTLLYSMLTAINGPGRPARNIMTVEDPVEYLLPGMSQTQVNRQAGMTFTVGLRGILRTDPDVVYLSQMRNLESAELCVEMALTGQLVLSQLHVTSALQVVQRLREMGIVNFLIGHILLGSVGVRLVRRICTNCVEEYAPSFSDLSKAGLSPVEDGPFRRGAGCEACRGTGYAGRIGLFEVLEADEAVRQMIIDEVPLPTIWYTTFGRNGGSLWDDARDKVRQGLTTLEEVNEALSDYPHPFNSVDAAWRAKVELG